MPLPAVVGAFPHGVTPVFHLNTGVFFCEDTFLWFRTVTVLAPESRVSLLKQRLIRALHQQFIMYYRYIIFSFVSRLAHKLARLFFARRWGGGLSGPVAAAGMGILRKRLIDMDFAGF